MENKNLEIKYSKEDLSKLIKNYYLEKEGREVNVVIKASKECVGLYETIECITTITVEEELTLLGLKTSQKETLSKDKLKNIISELLEEAGYTLNSLSYDEGISSSTVGYFRDEHTEYKAYFKGITLNISKKSLVKKLERH